MTTAETAADVQVPEIGEHPSPVDGDGAVESAPATFTFTPNGPEYGPPSGIPLARQQVDYGGPIVVPKTSVIVTPGTERWFFRQLHKVQEKVTARQASPLELAFFWLEHAGVDESVINRVALLEVEEWQRFYAGWMSGAADSNLGE
jgi:hypothetical protein